MKIYLDDNFTDKRVAASLLSAGHTIVRPSAVGLGGAPDPRHFEYAIRTDLVLLTKDHDDFLDLHHLVLTAGGGHSGILTVRYDNDSKRDMKPNQIVATIGKLGSSGMSIGNQFIVLNHWR